MSKNPRYDIVFDGVVLDRTTKQEATPETYALIVKALAHRCQSQGFNFFGNIAKGFIFHRTKNMQVRQLIHWQKQLEIILGGSYYFDGIFTIQDVDHLTLAQQRNLKKMMGASPEDGAPDDTNQ